MTTINNISKKILNDIQETFSEKTYNSNKETSSKKSSNSNKETSSKKSSNSNKETSSKKSSNSGKETSSEKSSNSNKETSSEKSSNSNKKTSEKSSNSNKETSSEKSSNSNKETSSEKSSNKEDEYGYYTDSKITIYKLLYILPVVYFIFYKKINVTVYIFIIWIFTYDFFLKKKNLLIKKSFKKNTIFWFFTVLSIIILSIKYGQEKTISNKIISGFISYILSIYYGWYIHKMSHTFHARKTFNYFRKQFSFKNVTINKFLNFYDNIVYFFSDIYDFHSKIHHNPNLNKLWYNRLLECIQNVVMISLPLSYIGYNSNIGITLSSVTFYLNKTITILWGLIYSTVHNINYSIINPQVHKEHHIKDIPYAYSTSKEKVTNYGPDIADIMWDTKYKSNIIEDFNHASINVITLTIIIIIIKSSNIEILRKLSNYI